MGNGLGQVGEVEGYLWMPRQCNKRGEEEAAAAVGGAMQKRKWYVLCHVFYCTFLGKASKIWEVGRKSLQSSYEVVTK